MKKILCIIGFVSVTIAAHSQCVLSLDSCRALALTNNKELRISRAKMDAAHYQRKAAFTSYLPDVAATGAYMRNQKEISLLSDDQKTALGSLGTQVSGVMQQGIQGLIGQHPELATNQQFMQMVQALSSVDIASPLNQVGGSLADALRTDTRNMYAGALTLTQPLYMGGKIRAYNKITRYAEELARQQHHTGMQEVILSTDQIYWQVVSLTHKKHLAESFLKLLRQMDSDVNRMIAEGVATKADGLTVRVKVNEAEMTLTKVDDGLSLSRMLLCQLCGLDLATPVTLVDEQEANLSAVIPAPRQIDMEGVYAARPEVRSLELARNIYEQKVNVTRSEFLPSLALMGTYMTSNPSVLNGFEKKFNGMWNVGVMLSVPVWHWGEGSYKVKAAKAEARIAQLNLDQAKEKIELQVNQSAFKVNEASKRLLMAEKNLEKADENLRYANLGFREGVIPANNVLEAHTAWLAAQSDKIDAQIEVKLTEVYLQKALGCLGSR